MYTQINIYLQIDVKLGISTGNETSVFTILYGQDLYVYCEFEIFYWIFKCALFIKLM